MNKYNKFMNKIEVTDEMRSRILKNISEADLTPQKKSFFVRYRSWIAAAACLALVVVGAVAVINSHNDGLVGGVSGNTANGAPGYSAGSEDDPMPDEMLGAEPPEGANLPTNDTTAIYDVTEYYTPEELSAAVGFSVKVPQEVPFSYDSVSYCKTWDFAEIDWYSGDEEAASFRKNISDDDVSGDCADYASVEELTSGDVTVTAKGDGSVIQLVVWNSGEYGYSLRVTGGITKEQALQFVSDVTE